MRKKFWALLMTIMMIATMVPASVFAGNGSDSQTAYFYIWKPGTAAGTSYVDAWYYAGTGSVKGLPKATASESKYYNYDKYVSEYPDSYPDIKGTDGHTYTYDKDGTGALYTYTINWAYIVDSSGANNGSEVITKDPVYHVDGYAMLNSPELVTVDFKVKQPEASNYVSLEKWPQVFKQGDTVTAPSVDSVVKYGDEEYMFDGWYLDAECTEKAEADDFTVMKNTIFYGKYERLYTVSYEIEGQIPGGDENKPALTETKKYVAGATVTVADAPETPTGYKFSGWATEDAVIGEDGTFVMPAKDVVLKGSFSIDENQTKTLTATVDYVDDQGSPLAETISLSVTVQVLDPDTLSTKGVEAKEFKGWELKNITVNGDTVEELPEYVDNGAKIVYHYDKVMVDVSYTVKHVTVNGEE
ncbi:MAG: InlB B-repeat-containing protein, partial [Lentihominibacter sp.]